MIIGYNSGNVGIGTSSPSRKLHVVGSAEISASINVTNGPVTTHFDNGNDNDGGTGISTTGGEVGLYARELVMVVLGAIALV